MDQRESMVGYDIDIQAYQDAVDRLREEFAMAKQSLVQFHKMLASNYLDAEDQKNLSKSMEPFINFVENKTKATIICTGSISCGKSSLLNALLGNCILPSGQLETTEAITKLIPSQELDPNTFILTKGNGLKENLNDIDLYRFLQEQNIREKQTNQNPLFQEIETNFFMLKHFKENPLLQRNQLEFVDLPGCDSEQDGKDQRILDFSSKLGDFPKLILFIISPENISKKSTRQFLDTARRVFTDEINNHKLVQNEFYTILKGLKEKEIINDNDNEFTEKLVQSRLCIVISKFDSVSQGDEAKKIEEQFLTKYQIQPNFVSSKKQIEYNTLKHQITPLNITILLNDNELKNKALKFLPKDRQAYLRRQGPSSWTEGDIKNVLDNVAQLFKGQFDDDENDETVEASTQMQQLVFQIMIKITNECSQYLKNNSRKIEFFSEVFSIGLDEKMIDEYIIPKDFKLFQQACDQCYADLTGEILNFQQQYETQLNTSIKKVVKSFFDVESYVVQIFQNLKSFNKELFESKLKDLFQTPLEGITNELEENMQNLTARTIEATIKSMRSQMPFLKEQIHTKISQILKAQILARQQVCKSTLKADVLNQFQQCEKTSFKIFITTFSTSFIGGIGGRLLVKKDSLGATTAATGFGLLLGLGVIASQVLINWQEQKTKQDITKTLKSEKENLIQLLRSNQDDNYKSNVQDINKSLGKVLQALDNAYAYKILLEAER